MIVRTLAFAAAFVSAGAAAADAGPRQPTGPWQVDHGPAQCIAIRNYGTTEKPVFLALKPSPLGGVMRLMIIRNGRSAVAQLPARLSFGGERALNTGLLTYESEENKTRAVSINVPMAQFRANLRAGTIRIESSALNESFAVTKLPEVTHELDKCLAELQQDWNIVTGDRHGRIRQEARPKKPIHRYYSASDYPWPALRDSQAGMAKLVFLVDEKGAVSDCSIDETSGVPSLDLMSCYVMQSRARFDPALGPNGTPVRSAYCQRVRWELSYSRRKEESVADDPRCPYGS